MGLAALAALTGCFATTNARADSASLQRGAQSREIVLRGGRLGARIGPSSWLRFNLRDGSRTPWYEAGKLRVGQDGVVTTGGEARPSGEAPETTGLAWRDVAFVEVNEFDEVQTLAGITAGAALVLSAAAAEAALVSALNTITRGHGPGELGITRGAFEFAVGQAFQRPPDDDKDDDKGDESERPPAVEAAIGESDARPLFTSEARRRELVLYTFSSEAGVDAGLGLGPVGGVAAGVRLFHLFDVQLGGRTSYAPPTAGNAAIVHSSPFLRVGLHVDLDPARRLALAVGTDVGVTPDDVRVRFLYGVRVRVTDRVQLGLYPWNPVAVAPMAPAASPTAGAAASPPSRLNLAELTWLF